MKLIMNGEVELLLLAPRPITEFAPRDYMTYIDSLRESYTGKLPPGISARINAKGTLVITTRRKVKWFVAAEAETISGELRIPINVVWNKLIEKGYVKVDSLKAGRELEEKLVA